MKLKVVKLFLEVEAMRIRVDFLIDGFGGLGCFDHFAGQSIHNGKEGLDEFFLLDVKELALHLSQFNEFAVDVGVQLF